MGPPSEIAYATLMPPQPVLPEILGALRGALEAQAGVHLALLFGSQARGAAGSSSDVDVAVLGREIDRLALAAALSDAVGREVDVVDLADPGVPLLEELALGRAAGLRNIVAHGYGAVDAAIVHGAATRGIADLELFAREVAGWATSQTSAPG